MTIGGIPHLHKAHINATMSTPSLTATVPIDSCGNSTSLLVYASSGFHYPNTAPHAGQGQYITDTGTYSNILPRSQADRINTIFEPPATFNSSTGNYVVLCNATAPPLDVEFGGKVFYHNPKDMIIPSPEESERSLCLSAIQTSTATIFLPILGATFLKNVLAVFDVGGTEMTFISRMYYDEEQWG